MDAETQGMLILSLQNYSCLHINVNFILPFFLCMEVSFLLYYLKQLQK